MFERGHGGVGRIGEGSEGPCWRNGALVASVVGRVGNISERAVAGGQSPGIRAVAREVFGIRDAISAVDQGNVARLFSK